MTDDSKLTMLGISILTCKIRLKLETDDFKVQVLAIFVSSFLVILAAADKKIWHVTVDDKIFF